MNFEAISNELITIRPLKVDDFDRLFEVASDPQIWEQHPDRFRYTAEGFKVYFEKLSQTEHPYLIIRNADNQIIGATSYYQVDELNKSIAIGYTFLCKECWGGYFNTSIKKLMIDNAFETFDKIIFHVREGNYRSQAALVKIGAIKDKEYPSAFDPDSLQLEYVLLK